MHTCVHPYHLGICELKDFPGAGTGGTTKTILNALDHRFQSYTFTDISAGFFGAAAAEFSSYQDRLVFRTLDIELDPYPQGFHEGAYDLVIASFVLHATASLSRTLANTRRLLRPGGFLVVGEGSVNTPASSFIFGPLPGWWLGRDDGRILTPHVSAKQWDQLLRENGFSGIDTKAPDAWEDVLGVCLFTSQAVDDTIRFLRSPLSASDTQYRPLVKSLVIVGGKEGHVARHVADVQALVKPYAVDLHVFLSLTDIDFGEVMTKDPSQTAVISLVDLDRPVFKGMTEAEFIGFQRMFGDGKTLLWVSSGRRSEEPFCNMVVGFGRTAVHETPGLNFQHLDVASPNSEGVAHTIAETFLRLVSRPAMVKDESGILWTTEPEIVTDSNGRYQVPRLQPLKPLNDRYNSGRRPISHDVDISKVPVSIHLDRQGVVTIEEILDAGHDETEAIGLQGHIKLRITHAVFPALRTPLGHKFLALGVQQGSEMQCLALLSSVQSLIEIPATRTIPFSPGHDAEVTVLSRIAAHLVASTIVQPVLPGQTILLHDVEDSVAYAAHVKAKEKGAKVVLVADRGFKVTHELSVLSLPPYLSQSGLWKLLPSKDQISCFVSLSSTMIRSESRDTILATLPPWCRVETSDTIYSSVGCDSGPIADDVVVQLVHQALDYAQDHGHRCPGEAKAFGLQQLKKNAETPSSCTNNSSSSKEENDYNGMVVMNLTTGTRLEANVRRLDSGRPMFKPNKTYWLVGMSGDLGISLCDWMISNAARHLVLSSRNPKVETSWADSHRHDGVSITIIPWYEDPPILR